MIVTANLDYMLYVTLFQFSLLESSFYFRYTSDDVCLKASEEFKIHNQHLTTINPITSIIT